MNPIDYTSAFADLPNPNQALMQGVKDGFGIQQLQLEHQRHADEAKARELKMQQAAQMNDDLHQLSLNPTSEAIGRMSIKYPALSENFKRSFDILEPAQKQAKLTQATQVYAALHSDKPEIAHQLLLEQAAAARNSGKEDDAKAAETFAALVHENPKFAMTSAGLLISNAVGHDKFATTFATLGTEQRAEELQPSAVTEAGAKAEGAVADTEVKKVGAKYAEQGALLDLEKKGWDVKKIKADIDIARESNRIAAMNAAANRESNSLKRQELGIKLQEAQLALDDKVRGKVADAESAAGNIDNMLNTIERIKTNPRLDAVLGGIEGRTPAITDEGSNAIALIETLGSQAFLSQIPNIKGMGALSNAEGEKLQAAFQNLSRVQGEEQFRATLDEATRLLMKGRSTVSKRFGVPLATPDTPAVRNTRAPLSSFEKK